MIRCDLQAFLASLSRLTEAIAARGIETVACGHVEERMDGSMVSQAYALARAIKDGSATRTRVIYGHDYGEYTDGTFTILARRTSST